jgi:antitoxin (DNA-binding transcriptional repressor) of toxin-antitoxin stability system
MADHSIHISEAEAARDFKGWLERVREGAEVVIELDGVPVAVIRPPESNVRMLSQSGEPHVPTLIERESARSLASLGGSMPGLKKIPRRRF